MKNFNLSIAYMAIFALIFTSCSKENEPGTNPDGEKVAITFGAIVNDFVENKAATKNHLSDIPECSDDMPAYVEVVVSQNGTNVAGTMSDPLRVNLVSGQVFTEEMPELKLHPDMYTLDYFTVHNSDGDVIWIAPQADSNLGAYVENSLPMNIDLGAGVKKYVDVSVLCYDNRDVNEYGYLFFELDTNRAIEFCIFGNYCDEDGRHYPAEYSVDVWSYANGARGIQMYDDVPSNVTMNSAGDYAASPVCFALPDNDGLDEYYFEITLRNSDAYGNVEERIIRAGVINDDDVRDMMEGENNVDYYHFREGNCGDMEDSDDLFDAEIYSADLSELNDSGVSGTASLLLVNGDQLTVKVDAYGLTPNMPHPQHIHGFENDENATCPPSEPGTAAFMEADTNNNGVININEGAPFYGPVLLPLYLPIDEFPVADANGEIHFERTFTLGEVEFEEEGEVISLTNLNPLVNRTIVLHGMYFDGEYLATLPVACGQIEQMH